jgi:flavin reductase (DIM6/NTAB) family NADH-FMN oxidoreductase RutF
MDSKAFRDALGRFLTGIAVVATHTPGGKRIGMTINTLVSVSLDPPLVLYCLGRESMDYETFASATSFAFNILKEEDEEISNRFIVRGDDRFAGIETDVSVSGAPVMRNALAVIDCKRERIVEAGDHLIVMGRVVDVRSSEGKPLAYFKGGYGKFSG